MLLNVLDYEAAAAEKMDSLAYGYVAGGVCEDSSLRDNRACWERIRLVPSVLRAVGEPSVSCQVMGLEQPMPLMIAPAAAHKLAHEEGELATARAAKSLGVTQVLSTMSNVSVEDVASVGHDVWFQLYIDRERELTESIVQRAEKAGCKALVLTVDVPVFGLRENLVRAGWDPSLFKELPHLATEQDPSGMEGLVRMSFAGIDPALDWETVTWLQSITSMPVWVKGVLNPDDACRALDAGCAGVMVSNHGGRQLDTVVSAVDVLPAIRKAVGSQAQLIVDGGVRRGMDIFKALAFGANAVMVGRPIHWGLALEGESGVRRILEILQHELVNTMQQCGCTSIADIGPQHVLWQQQYLPI